MKWAEVSIHTTNEATESVANILHEAGAGGVIIEDPSESDQESTILQNEILPFADQQKDEVYIKAYFPVNSYLMETIEQIKAEINNLVTYEINIGKGNVFVTEVHEDDWASNWKQYYKPVEIGQNFLIAPIWEQTESRTDQLVIELDPGMAFGTGTHPTTVMCIEALENVIKGNEKVIDVGCGTGVLSIAAAKLGVSSVIALDLDEVAIDSAKRNTKINKVDSLIEVRKNNLLDDIESGADIIVANILSEIIVHLTNDVARVLKTNGFFITSGIIQTKAELVKDSIESAGLTVIDTLNIDDWVAFVAKKV